MKPRLRLTTESLEWQKNYTDWRVGIDADRTIIIAIIPHVRYNDY